MARLDFGIQHIAIDLHRAGLLVLRRDAAFDQVGGTDELGHEARGRVFVQAGRGGHLFDHAGIHHRQARGHGHGFLLVVRDQHKGRTDALLDVHQLELGVFAQFAVQRAQRFVQQQQLGLLGQRARQCHALALAAG